MNLPQNIDNNFLAAPEPAVINTSPKPASSILQALRSATHSRHAILDSQMPLAKPDAGLADYRAHLRLLAAWLAPLEQWLTNFSDGPQGPDAPPFIARTPLLMADLEQAFSDCPPLAWATNDCAAYRWGIAYVIEGSQLGGAMLFRRLSARLAPHPLRYLQDEAASPGRWPHFLKTLASHNTSPEQLAQACAGATDAFDALLHLLAAGENNYA